MRQSLDSNDTSSRIQAATKAGTSPLTFSDFFSGAVLAGTASPPPTQLAAYIWDLRFRIDTDLNDSAATHPDGNASNAPLDHSAPTQRAYVGDASQPYPPRLPAYVEIRFKALSDLAGRRLEANPSVSKSTWNDTVPNFSPSTPYCTIIQPNAQQFVLRVPLINATPLPTISASASPTP